MFSLFGKTPPSLIRPLDMAAAQDCARLHESAFAHAWSEADFERLLGARTTVADGIFDSHGQALFGFVLSQTVADEAEILSIVLDPHHRRRGLGRQLLNAHMARLTEAQVKSLFLEVEDGNVAAQGLYAHLGFHEIGKRHGYYRKADGSTATALMLRCDLG
ncbi:ribosomal protein S18-alanine N-acetyltransferase [Methylovirgula sp. 4M-Z18]|uniref:ribosomal protein S18-alanine N-acetyltransferase n=1 Tax=Methylovirgula sp. 4M-Z18 TaxID=2293567 RepID=UPI000E2E4414|nr:ribosomal protein S18-alanine N-acetyltransferase [Methylovirgula sp. 4M-Z18]RFB78084.1 ribosomal-protein-alanine N-acetyltransferase [Methylovirgula sp. 4M-Z18]